MKIHWTKDYDSVGNGFGYTHHNRMMKQEVGKIAELTEDADVAVTITPADKFEPVQGKYNFLFTMFEANALPNCYIDGMEKADEIIVPCRWVKELFKRYTTKPVSVCHEGADAAAFPYLIRQFPMNGTKFRVLWIGAPNPRKGYPIMAEICRIFEAVPDVEIYMKTTAPAVEYDKDWREKFEKAREVVTDMTKKKRIEEMLKNPAEGAPEPLRGKVIRAGQHKNIIFDARVLNQEELLDLYHSAHVFVMPSVGEGWGLTLTEAMLTGAPCIAPAHTGMAEYFDETVGWTIGFEEKQSEFANYAIRAGVFVPSPVEVLAKICQVFKNYDEAIVRAWKAHERIRDRFTWPRAGKRLVDIIEGSKGYAAFRQQAEPAEAVAA